MTLKNLADLFYDELCDIYSAEQQLVEALPKMQEKATNPKLAEAFEKHLAQTQKQVERVEKAFADTGKVPKAKTCKAMKGLIEEASSMMKENADADVMDAALIACAQKVEHYEIATYGTLCTWAESVGYKGALKLLKQSMDEEEKTDKLLSELAVKINASAMA